MHTHLSARKNSNHANRSISGALLNLKLVLCLLAAVFLSGCGNKGDLYLPDKNEAKQQSSQTTKPGQT